MTDIHLIGNPIPLEDIKSAAQQSFGDFVKAVVDIEKGTIAIGGELHADEEALLLERGSRQENLWGINIYPDMVMPEMIEFDSMINIRPSQNNNSRDIESQDTRKKIIDIVAKLVIPS